MFSINSLFCGTYHFSLNALIDSNFEPFLLLTFCSNVLHLARHCVKIHIPVVLSANDNIMIIYTAAQLLSYLHCFYLQHCWLFFSHSNLKGTGRTLNGLNSVVVQKVGTPKGSNFKICIQIQFTMSIFNNYHVTNDWQILQYNKSKYL